VFRATKRFRSAYLTTQGSPATKLNTNGFQKAICYLLIRNVVLTTLDKAQKMLNSHEGQAGFKLSINIALFAIVVSLLVVAVG
jgi:hypothetical protein